MTLVEQELEDFSRFVRRRLDTEPTASSLGVLMDEWRLENWSETEFAEDVAALQLAIDDLKNGDRGRLAREVIQELRESLRDKQQ